MSFDAIIFDMDGVVLDSEKYWRDSDILFLSALIPHFDVKRFPKFLGQGTHYVYKQVCDIFDFDISEADFVRLRMEAAKENVYPKAELMPGFLHFLRQYRDSHQIALGTSSPLSLVEYIFDRLGLHSAFDAIATIDDANGVGKPAPDIFLAAADKLGVFPRKCLVIEDADAGIEAGKRAGMTVYAYRNGLNDHQSLSQADRVFSDYSEIEL